MGWIDRRTFLRSSAAALAGLSLARAKGGSANEKIVLGVMGFRGRGGSLLRGFLEIPQVEVAALSDVDYVVRQGEEAVFRDLLRAELGFADDVEYVGFNRGEDDARFPESLGCLHQLIE